MLFDPTILSREPLPVLATVLIIVFGKSIAAFAIVRLFGYPNSTALTISASLAQIGEFSFILAGLGVSLTLMPERARDLILAGALISIMLNPLFFAALDWVLAKGERRREAEAGASAAQAAAAAAAAREEIPQTSLSGHIVLVGHGRVGRVVTAALKDAPAPLLIIETDDDLADQLRGRGYEVITGNAADPDVSRAANLARARCLLVAIPDAFEGGQVVAEARAVNPTLPIIARSHSDEETAHLKKHGASLVIMGEEEIGKAMIADACGRFAPAGP